MRRLLILGLLEEESQVSYYHEDILLIYCGDSMESPEYNIIYNTSTRQMYFMEQWHREP